VNPRFPDLEGRHVLITGGSNGIGAAIAIAFARQGCQVTLLDKDVEAGGQVIGACHDLGADACLREVDLVDSRALCDVLARVKREQPTVDVLIANAGYDPRFAGLDMSEQQWHDLIAYNSTKAAVIGFMRSLAEDVGRHRIRVNAVAPGWTMTDRQLRQWVTEESKHRTIHEHQVMPIEITPDELTGTYLFLASDCSRPITRQVLVADAGQSKH
jgi:NAD(P)-dependent dehydrogenase (short-subunit alcohol dehydrogenase family)